ncbi:MAG: hypothetical protein FWB76_00070 [Oscillospiraceae bacterium]|nr:hypothetical protein [Oscillospiraceae bacterium]
MKKLLSILLAILLMGIIVFAVTVSVVAHGNDDNWWIGVDFTPPANLDQLSAEEQLEYFNLVAQRVRTQMPEFSERSRFWIDIPNMLFSGSVALVQPIIDSMILDFYPGHWFTWQNFLGESNRGLFLSSGHYASSLGLENIDSIAVEQQENNWVIEVNVRNETNPLGGLYSSVGRIAPVFDREFIFRELEFSGAPIEADMDNVTLYYHSVYARLVVNQQGQVISGSKGYRILADVRNVRIGRGIFSVTTDAIIPQVSEWQYANFVWPVVDCNGNIVLNDYGYPVADESGETVDFPPYTPGDPWIVENGLCPCVMRWYNRVPNWLHWILRWIAFGWIWMCC